MRGKNGRVMVTLEAHIYSFVRKLSKRRGVSISSLMGDMTKEWLERHEDYVFAKECEERLATFSRKKALTHEEVWRHIK